MENSSVKLSVAFEEPGLERAFRESLGRTRQVGDALIMTISTIVFSTYYLIGVYDSATAQFLRYEQQLRNYRW
jgi:hypothetical protein